MRVLIATALCLVVLAGCSIGAGQRVEMAAYDLGLRSQNTSSPLALLERVEVQAPSWLMTPAMQYRLAAEPGRRHSFVESRWAASPAELLEAALKRQLTAAGHCRLRVDLDEFIQVFDAASDSQARLAFRATLISARGGEVLSTRRFELEQPAGRNAGSGAAAFAVLGDRMISEILRWLVPQSPEVCTQ